MPPEILERHTTWLDHHVALAMIFWRWAVQCSLELNTMPRYLYVATVFTVWSVVVPLRLHLERERSGGIVSWRVQEKFMRTSLLSSNGELWEIDQLKLSLGAPSWL